MPVSGAACTSTARHGRWRSFPYLAELKGEEGDALWGYLCKEWNKENPPEKHLLRFNFFMLQADVLPNMGFVSICGLPSRETLRMMLTPRFFISYPSERYSQKTHPLS